MCACRLKGVGDVQTFHTVTCRLEEETLEKFRLLSLKSLYECSVFRLPIFLRYFFAIVTELSVPPVSGWLTARRDQLNSSGPCSSQPEPACSRGCAGWAPLRGSRSCSGRRCRSGGTAGRGEGKRGCSSWKERHPAGNGYPRCSGYDWKQGEGDKEKQEKRRRQRVEM